MIRLAALKTHWYYDDHEKGVYYISNDKNVQLYILVNNESGQLGSL